MEVTWSLIPGRSCCLAGGAQDHWAQSPQVLPQRHTLPDPHVFLLVTRIHCQHTNGRFTQKLRLLASPKHGRPGLHRAPFLLQDRPRRGCPAGQAWTCCLARQGGT